MARFASGYRTSGAGSTTLPMASIYGTAAVRPRLVEVGVFNTTTTQVALVLQRFTTAGTSTAITTVAYENDNSQAAVTTVRNTHSSTAPTAGTILRQFSLGAAIGSGVVLTFGGGVTSGIVIPNSTADGIGLMCATGTGQICDVYWVWDE